MTKRLSSILLPVVLLGLSFSLTGCLDWLHYNFMNSIPFKGDANKNPEVRVYLGVDGLSYWTTKEAMKHGAFAGDSWKVSKFITMFPGTSDASWTRILHTKKLDGYEIEYYDPKADKIVNEGIIGVMKHVLPNFAETFSFEFQYLKGFDYRANGYTHSFHAYSDTFSSLAESIDNMLFLLAGRAETSSTFTAYLLEMDVLGHMRNPEDITKGLEILYDRIEKFKKSHSDRTFYFTLFSDHGMDFIQVEKEKAVSFKDELRKVGIEPVKSIRGRDPSQGPFAIPIMHTWVTYISLHTHDDLIEEVAGLTSKLESVDVTISKLLDPSFIPKGSKAPDWYGIWAKGKLAIPFGFDPSRNEYHLPAKANYKRLGIKPDFFDGKDWAILKDKEIFEMTKHSEYPDLFYRVRTALEPVGVEYPADVLVSFEPGYLSMGFKVPLKSEIATNSFHGSLRDLGTIGTLITDEQDLPDAVRADQLLTLFPNLKEHLSKMPVTFEAGDSNAEF
jgi:hypothetical protein